MQPRDAATVMLVRDGRSGLETFMLRRRLELAFAPGAYVFPGGAVDPEDSFDDIALRCEGLGDAEASARLSLERGGLAFWIAAVREAFEEAGVFLAYDHNGTLVHLDHDGHAQRFREHRAEVDSGRRHLAEVCKAEQLRLAVDAMHYFGRWITPAGSPRRFDTRFFLAEAPVGQTPVHDDVETVSGQWIRPSDALAHGATGQWDLILPTARSLEIIGRFDRVETLVRGVRSAQGRGGRGASLVDDSGGWRVSLPGDDESVVDQGSWSVRRRP